MLKSLLALHQALLPIYASEVTTRLLPLVVRHKADSPILSSVALRSQSSSSGLVAELAGHLPGRQRSTNTRLRGGLTRCFIPATFLVELPAGGGYL